DRARSALSRLCARHPEDPDLLAYLARVHLREGALDDADAVLARWPSDRPSPPAIEALRGELCRRTDAPERALVHFGHAASEWVTPSDAHRCRACGAGRAGWAARCACCGRWGTIEPAVDFGHPDRSGGLMPSGRGSASPNHCADETSG